MSDPFVIGPEDVAVVPAAALAAKRAVPAPIAKDVVVPARSARLLPRSFGVQFGRAVVRGDDEHEVRAISTGAAWTDDAGRNVTETAGNYGEPELERPPAADLAALGAELAAAPTLAAALDVFAKLLAAGVR